MIFLVFFLPLAIYFSYLARLNRKPHGTVVPGVWDAVGLLFAVSGFLLVGGPAALSGLYEQWRMFWLVGSMYRLRELNTRWFAWILLFAGYFAFVCGLAFWILLHGRRRTSVYNVEARAFPLLLARTLKNAGLSFRAAGPCGLVLADEDGESPYESTMAGEVSSA